MTTGPFVVHVAQLRRDPGARWREVRSGRIDGHDGHDGHDGTDRAGGVSLGTSPADSSVPPGAECEIDAVLEPFIGGVMVTGTVRAPWRGVCRRCTTPVGGELVVPVAERFLDEPDEESYPVTDDVLDLAPLVTDAVLLELPLAPLCREDCAGLCPWCGNDRNLEPCACVAPRDPRWANLDVLR